MYFSAACVVIRMRYLLYTIVYCFERSLVKCLFIRSLYSTHIETKKLKYLVLSDVLCLLIACFFTLDISHKSFINCQILNSEISALLGYYAAYTSHSLPTSRDILSDLSSVAEDGTARLSRNVGTNYHYTPRNIPE